MKVLLWLALAAGIIAGATWEYHRIYNEGYKAAEAVERQVASDALKTANAASAARTQAMQDAANAEALQRFNDKEQYDKSLAALRATARAGNSGLRIDTTADPVPATGAPTSASAATGFVAPTSHGLMPGTADAIFRIAAASRNDVLAYNALLAAFNACRATANTP